MLEQVPDEEVGAIASLITRAFRHVDWHTEDQLVSNFTLTEDQLRTQVNSVKPNGVLLQMKDDTGKRLGCISIRSLDQSHLKWRFGWFAIEPELQTTGIGKTILNDTEEYVKSKGGKVICMTAINVRKNLIAWYMRRGYSLTGETEPFVHAKDQHGIQLQEDLCFLVMQKDL